MRYIRHYNNSLNTNKWKYVDPTRRIIHYEFKCYRPLVTKCSIAVKLEVPAGGAICSPNVR